MVGDAFSSPTRPFDASLIVLECLLLSGLAAFRATPKPRSSVREVLTVGSSVLAPAAHSERTCICILDCEAAWDDHNGHKQTSSRRYARSSPWTAHPPRSTGIAWCRS